jgi:hypothetical protein
VKVGDRVRATVPLGEPGWPGSVSAGGLGTVVRGGHEDRLPLVDFDDDATPHPWPVELHEVEPFEPATILDEAAQLVNGDRQRDYGHPRDNLARIALGWSMVLDRPVTAKEVGLCMVVLKLAREVATPKRDNIVDGAGYLRMLEVAGEVGS